MYNFYYQMFLIRTVELTLLEYYRKGYIKGTVHTCIGQEACAVGLLSAVNKEIDIIFSNHRAHGHFIAYGAPIEGLVAEIMGKISGVCKGVGGSQHLYWKNFYTNGIQGGMVPSAIGAGFAEKMKKTDAVVVVFLGDGTMGQGTVYEGFNLSSLWRLPIVFVLENNGYAQTTPVYLAHAGDLEHRAKPFGIVTKSVNGNDVEEVYNVSIEIVKYARKNSMPAFIVLNTYRLGPHSKGDDTRPLEEIEKHKKNDPLVVTANSITITEREEIESKILGLTKRIFENTICKGIAPISELYRTHSTKNVP